MKLETKIKCEKCGYEFNISKNLKSRYIKKEIRKLGGEYLGDKKVLCYFCSISKNKEEGWINIFKYLYELSKKEVVRIYLEKFKTIDRCPLINECPSDDTCRNCGLTFKEFIKLVDFLWEERKKSKIDNY